MVKKFPAMYMHSVTHILCFAYTSTGNSFSFFADVYMYNGEEVRGSGGEGEPNTWALGSILDPNHTWALGSILDPNHTWALGSILDPNHSWGTGFTLRS